MNPFHISGVSRSESYHGWVSGEWETTTNIIFSIPICPSQKKTKKKHDIAFPLIENWLITTSDLLINWEINYVGQKKVVKLVVLEAKYKVININKKMKNLLLS